MPTADMGYSDIGCYGSEINTPNIDALAAKHPDIVKKLNAKWDSWAERCNVLPMNPNRKK